MRRRAGTESLPPPHHAETISCAAPCIYSHVSTYRSSQLELQLYSPTVKVESRGPIAVFNAQDQISGKLFLDSTAHHTGKLLLSVEGAFLYPATGSSDHHHSSESRKHVFFTHSQSFTVSMKPSGRTTFREGFMRRRPSESSRLGDYMKSSFRERSYPFQFPLPQGSHPGQDLPPTFASHGNEESGLVVTSEISYKIMATWEPDNLDHPTSYIEIPFILEQDADFESSGADLNNGRDDWVEIPLVTERPMPAKFAIALPSTTFCRNSSIPYFVVFSTTPRPSSYAREIASDSTIYVALTRQIVVNEPQTMIPLTPPPTPPLQAYYRSPQSPARSDDSDSSSSSNNNNNSATPGLRLLRRVAKSTTRLSRKRQIDEMLQLDKPLPTIPMKSCFSESKAAFCDLFIGFAKRPRRHLKTGAKHPTLEEQSSLPDGLHRSKIPLDESMLPCIDWAGVSVKYYLDVSVSIGHDDWRARIPIGIY